MATVETEGPPVTSPRGKLLFPLSDRVCEAGTAGGAIASCKKTNDDDDNKPRKRGPGLRKGVDSTSSETSRKGQGTSRPRFPGFQPPTPRQNTWKGPWGGGGALALTAQKRPVAKRTTSSKRSPQPMQVPHAGRLRSRGPFRAWVLRVPSLRGPSASCPRALRCALSQALDLLNPGPATQAPRPREAPAESWTWCPRW